MTLIEAIVLGIVQGATEFLPVSSSGHSVLIPALLGLNDPGLTAVVVAHQGTLLAVLIYFWRDVLAILRGWAQGIATRAPMGSVEARLGWFILLGSIPAAVVGLAFESQFEQVFSDERWAAFFLLITALFLVMGERLHSGARSAEQMTWLDALVIGLFQMFALLPGLSRSGSTIVGGLLRGLDRSLAARYSFLLSMPVIFGAGLIGFTDLADDANLMAQLPTLLVVFVLSAGVGLACIHFLLQWIRTRSLIPFAIYTATFGALYLIGSFFFGLG